jgi:hypothetical protein
VGRTLQGKGVSGAACASLGLVSVPNVLMNPAVHYFEMMRYGLAPGESVIKICADIHLNNSHDRMYI